MTSPLAGKTALITGVSRRRGIGFGIAAELARLGAHVFLHHYSPYDRHQPWGDDDLSLIRSGIRERLIDGAAFGDVSADLSLPDGHETVMDAAVELTGTVDIMVCNHATDGSGSIFDVTAAQLDTCWNVNTRSTLLLTRRFAEQYAPRSAADPKRPGDRDRPEQHVDEHRTGRVIWLTSGQQDGPMRGEVAYATTKAALAGVTPTVAAELLERGIVLNTVNPGPVNTGYLDPETTDRDLTELTAMIAETPYGRFGTPEDPARLIGWLVTDAARWMVGQVLTSDGGFAVNG
ncbi:3-oxoacyl-[acyl-carrier protein] reductase [Stackebrandtia endophytica]|uniref:3-oxoacyl-[acyl-carrier protein] reductase n=1 Tax=Stackebrandtia endophytica TaxID=1496996 RepID=A0A543B1D4_9ACTN|nr:SDR family oxidoreductase [Stackebrandtia endophytica]TQL78638.1 3-oxoacyl-[acyl-carrier protein] reductase [Stackebrandtia endophytica]